MAMPRVRETPWRVSAEKWRGCSAYLQTTKSSRSSHRARGYRVYRDRADGCCGAYLKKKASATDASWHTTKFTWTPKTRTRLSTVFHFAHVSSLLHYFFSTLTEKLMKWKSAIETVQSKGVNEKNNFK